MALLAVPSGSVTVNECLECAQYAVERLQELGIDAWRNPHAITVVLPKPAPLVLEKWQLAVQGEIAHMMVMPHISREKIDQFIF